VGHIKNVQSNKVKETFSAHTDEQPWQPPKRIRAVLRDNGGGRGNRLQSWKGAPDLFHIEKEEDFEWFFMDLQGVGDRLAEWGGQSFPVGKDRNTVFISERPRK